MLLFDTDCIAKFYHFVTVFAIFEKFYMILTSLLNIDSRCYPVDVLHRYTCTPISGNCLSHLITSPVKTCAGTLRKHD